MVEDFYFAELFEVNRCEKFLDMDDGKSIFEAKNINKRVNNGEEKSIFLDPFPAMGHINAFLNLAKWLLSQGFRPVFLISQEYEGKVRQEGFARYVVAPMLLIPAKSERKQKGALRFFLDNLYKGRDKVARDYMLKTKETYKKAFREENCKQVLLDIHYISKAIFYHFSGLEVNQVATAMLPFKHSKSPPFQSSHVPGKGVISSIGISALWRLNRMKRDIQNSIGYILSLGQTDLNIMLKTFTQRRYAFDRNRALGWGIKGMSTVATYPKSFDLVDL